MAKNKTFKSVDEIVKTYWPKELQRPEDNAPADPKAAGDELGRRVVETFGRELAARLQQESRKTGRA